MDYSRDLHPDSERMLNKCFVDLKEKMIQNQIKYGYTNEWMSQDWEEECKEHMMKHIFKGDPKDVAIYAMFMMIRGWSTKNFKHPYDSEQMSLLHHISHKYGQENFVSAYVEQECVEEIVTEAMQCYNVQLTERLKEAKKIVKWYMENTKPDNDYQTFHDLGMNFIQG